MRAPLACHPPSHKVVNFWVSHFYKLVYYYICLFFDWGGWLIGMQLSLGSAGLTAKTKTSSQFPLPFASKLFQPTMSHYSLEDTINEFFYGRTVTQDQCDQTATELTGQVVEPVQLQGAFSYTLAAGEQLLVQFRGLDSLLDTKVVDLAREIYGDIVPACVNRGVIGPPPSLTVCLMDKVPGITYIEVPLKKIRCISWQEQTLSDFARYFALLVCCRTSIDLF